MVPLGRADAAVTLLFVVGSAIETKRGACTVVYQPPTVGGVSTLYVPPGVAPMLLLFFPSLTVGRDNTLRSFFCCCHTAFTGL